MKRNKQFICCALSLLITITALPLMSPTTMTAFSPYPIQATDTQVADALNYLRGEQTTSGDIGGFAASAWVIMAIAAAGEDPNDWSTNPGTDPSIVDYLRDNVASATTLNDYARTALAIVSAQEDPSGFGPSGSEIDFLSLIQSEHDGTQFGESDLLNDDFWPLMALIASGIGQDEAIVTSTVSFIKTNQNIDGGWSWGVGGDSDVDDTAAAIMALIAAGEDQTSTEITDGLAYIKSMQMDNGGFDSWGSTNADTDSWATMSIVMAGQDPTHTTWQSGTGNDALDDLVTFQQGDGSFHWQNGTPGMSVPKTTATAIQALLGKPWPTGGYTINIRVEGQTTTVFSGDVTVWQSRIVADNSSVLHTLLQPTAIGALDKASQIGGFPYETTDAYGSLFVTSIAGEANAGTDGWQYWIDYATPAVGAADFLFSETTPPNPPHQEEIWGYGGFPLYPLLIESSSYTVDVDESFTITVTDESGPVADATVSIDGVAQADLTNASGQVTLALSTDGTVEIHADKDGSVRSERINVTAEEGGGPPPEPEEDGAISLSSTIAPAIAISVSPDAMVFESELYDNLGPGDISAPETLTVDNLGTLSLDITVGVTPSSDNLFREGVHVEAVLWSEYIRENLTRSETMNADATLVVPETYSEIGEKTGVMIIWAEAT
ncbi:MAG: prenyltransferase/squalene oxidase repeat-containing protein [Chloroflexota bacterium]|nr:prenyltransferase/squalene oxidase repeat-containing protein [Chloroflexota bacterium]